MPITVATPLHAILVSVHIHPVNLVLKMESQQVLVQEASVVGGALHTISLHLVNDQKEGLAFKAHYVAFLLDMVRKHGSEPIIKRYSHLAQDHQSQKIFEAIVACNYCEQLNCLVYVGEWLATHSLKLSICNRSCLYPKQYIIFELGANSFKNK